MFNNSKLFIANNECIKVANVSQNLDDNTPEEKKIVNHGQVGTIQLYDEAKAIKERVKVHGLGITKDGRAGPDKADWIHVYVEILGESKISINQLYVSKLPGDGVDNDG